FRSRDDDAAVTHDCNATGRVEPISDGAHSTIVRNQPNAIVVSVGDVDTALRIDGDSDWTIEPSLRCWSIDVSGGSITGNCRDLALRCDLSYAVVACVCDEEVTVNAEGKSGRRVERSCRTHSIREALAAASERRHVAVRRYLSTAIALASVGDVDRSLGRDSDANRIGDFCFTP